MVAIVSGNGVGFNNLSAAAHGKAREDVFLDIASGNLRLQHQDDFVAANGIDLALTRTYNSLGGIAEGMGAQWKTGLFKQVANLTGSLNTAGSTVSRIDGDGSVSVYSFDAGLGLYVSSDGDGPYRTLQMDEAQHWVWRDNRDGEGQVERYDSQQGGRIVSAQDYAGRGLAYHYNAKGQVSKITNASGDSTHFDYDSRDNLAQVRTVSGSTGLAVVRVRYSYDQLNRLHQVATDLTPGDGEGFDGKIYATDYTYDGNSSRVATVRQSDGSSISFTYQQHGGQWKVASFKEGTAAATTFDYSVAGKTNVTDPAGRATTYTYDGASRLTQILGPLENGVSRQVDYAYDAKGNVLSALENGVGRLYEYDGWGNRTREKNEQGVLLVSREYQAGSNRLLEETDYTGVTAATTKLAYSAAGNLRFVVDGAGLVREHRYDAAGQRIATVRYTGSVYAASATVSEADLQAWIDSLGAAVSSASRTDYAYDARGLVERVTEFATLDAIGVVTRYTHDQSGRVLQVIDAQNRVTDLAYDGMGRLLGATSANGAASVTTYDDANNRTVTTLFAGWSQTSVYAQNGTTLFADHAANAITDSTSGADDMIDALGGDDILQGGAGNDIYVFGRGDGRDTILADTDATASKINTLRFKAGVAPADVAVKRVGNDLVVSINGTTDSVTAISFFANDDTGNAANPLQQVQFSNGDSWNLAAITARIIAGTPGNDRISGVAGNDLIDGGAGDDILAGRAGNDTFVFGRGWGRDRIQADFDNRADRADIVSMRGGVLPTELTFTRSSYDLVIGIAGATDTLTIGAFYFAENPNNPYNPVRGIQFENGINWSLADLISRAPVATPGASTTGTAASETLNGTGANELFYGLDGNDTLNPGTGNDTLVGGRGNDSLQGAAGSDVYVVSRGDGADTIYDASHDGSSGTETVVFIDVASTEVTAVEKRGDHLFISYGANDSLLIQNNFGGSAPNHVELIRFADGVDWSRSALTALTVNSGTSGSEVINGGYFSVNQLRGYAGNDTIDATHQADTIIGGAGNDSIIGGRGNDVYVVSRGDGLDTITDNDTVSGNSDTIYLIDTPSTAVMQRDHLDISKLYLAMLGRRPDAAELAYFSSRFLRGYTYAEIASAVLSTVEGANYFPPAQSNSGFVTTLYQRMFGRNPGADELAAAIASIETPPGSRGALVDQLVRNASGSIDKQFWNAKLGDLAKAVLLERSGNNLLVRYGDNDQVTVVNHFYSTPDRVEQLKFNDGVTLSLNSLLPLTMMYGGDGPDDLQLGYTSTRVVGGGGNDSISSRDPAAQLYGGSGNDSIYGAAGSDTLVGGIGNDTLEGGAQADTFQFWVGDGNDTVRDYDQYDSTPDVIQFMDIPSGAVTTREHVAITKYFLALHGRLPSTSEVEPLVAEHLRGHTLASIVNRLLVSPEAQSYFHAAQTDSEFVSAVYFRTLARTPTAQELGAGIDLLRSSGSRGEMVIQFIATFAQADLATWSAKLGILANPVIFDRAGTALLIRYGAADSITIENYYSSSSSERTYSRIERVRFSDGVELATSTLISRMGLYGTQGNDTMSIDWMVPRALGGDGDDSIYSTAEHDELLGGAGNDTLKGVEGNDTIVGGLGNDSLDGAWGNDTYVFATGDGSDQLIDISGTDTLHFIDTASAALTTREKLAIARLYQAVLAQQPDRAAFDVHIPSYLRGFTMGQIAGQLLEEPAALSYYGHNSSDAEFVQRLFQRMFDRDPTLSELAEGVAIVQVPGTRGLLVETLILKAPTPLDQKTWHAKLGPMAQPMTLERSGQDLVINYGNGDRVTVQRHYDMANPTIYRIDQFKFSDGVTVAVSDATVDIVRYGTEAADSFSGYYASNRYYGLGGNDTITGSYVGEVIEGGAGNDSISGENGADTIVGGLGDDRLIGGNSDSNSDVYVFSTGDGTDWVVDHKVASILHFKDVLPGSYTTREKLFVHKVHLALLGELAGTESVEALTFEILRGVSKPKIIDLVLGSSAGLSAFPVELSAEAFVDRLYSQMLNRAPTVTERNAMALLVQGQPNGRALVLESLLASTFQGRDRDVWTSKLGQLATPMLMERTGNHLKITYGQSDTVYMEKYFEQSQRPGTVKFADGTLLQLAPLFERFVQYGTDSNDSMPYDWNYGRTTVSLDGDDTIEAYNSTLYYSGAGNDSITAHGGDDTIIGGLGNDYFNDDAGHDQYIFSRGDGHDTIYDRKTYYRDYTDTIVFRDVPSSALMPKDELELGRLYCAILGRPPEGAGLEYWMNVMKRGLSVGQAAEFMLNSAEANSYFALQSDDAIFVESLYQRMFDRAPTEAELSIALAKMREPLMGRGLFVRHTIASEMNAVDRATWNSKLGRFARPVLIERIGDDLIVKYGDDSINIRNCFGVDNYQHMERMRFSDGVEIDFFSYYMREGFVYGSESSEYIGGTFTRNVRANGGDDTVSLGGWAANMYGGAGNDSLIASGNGGTSGPDTFIGGFGNDTMAGWIGDDTYIIYRGDGQDSISDTNGVNVVWFKDLNQSEVTWTSNGTKLIGRYGDNDLVEVDRNVGKFRYRDTEVDSTTVAAPSTLTGNANANSLTGSIYGPNKISGLAGNDTLTGQGFNDWLDGGIGNDTITGNGGNDTLIGGAGNDTMNAGAGNDVYSFDRGFGSDLIRNTDTDAGRVDTIMFGAGIVQGDLAVSRATNNLVIRVNNPASPTSVDLITVENWYVAPTNRIDQVKFADGSTISVSQLELMAAARYGTANNDSIAGTMVDEAIYGLAGKDTITDAGGNDYIDGGDDNDLINDLGPGSNQLLGGAGNDTIRFSDSSSNAISGGSGNDAIEMVGYVHADASAQSNTIMGGAGNDRSESGSSADTYIFNLGDGQDTIIDYDSGSAKKIDKLVFGENISMGDLRVSRSGDHLLIKIAGPMGLTGDQVQIENWYQNDKFRLEEFVFANGSTVSKTQIEQLSLIPPNSNGLAEKSLGLDNATAAALSTASSIGQSRQTVYLNSANGNLVLQGQDDAMASTGIDLGLLRTYNSQGDGWRIGATRKISVTESGALVRTADDGSAQYFVEFAGRYISTDGAGAYDTIVFNNTDKTWELTDGATGTVEAYDSLNNGRLKSATDISKNVITYSYDSNQRLSTILNASKEGMEFKYDAAGRVTSVREFFMKEGRYLDDATRVHYGYDGLGRLETVSIDLTPDDDSIADNKAYTTTYTYEGSSNLVATMRQTDGTSLTFTYEDVAGKPMLATVTDALGRVTRVSRDGLSTTVSVDNGASTKFVYDAAGQLLTVTDLALGQTSEFAYDAQGNVQSITAADRVVTSFAYDANGNQILQTIDGVQAISRTFHSKPGRMLTESVSLSPGVANSPVVTSRNVYDDNGRLRYAVSSEGRVTEHRYNGLGNLSATIEYTGATFDVSALTQSQSPSKASLDLWCDATDKTRTVRTDYLYDLRGLVTESKTYTSVDANGEGISDSATTKNTFVYDQAGQLRYSIDANMRQLSYVYDGMGRVTSTSDTGGQLSSLTVYDDVGGKIVTTSKETGVVVTRAYDKAGQLLSVETKAGAINGVTTTSYDKLGRPVMVQGADGTRAFMFYDISGRKVADVDADGSVVEYFYNKNNQLAHTRAYFNRANVASLVQADGSVADLNFSQVRPQADLARDRDSWQYYDAAGRPTVTVDDQGHVTRTVYDGASRIVAVIQRAIPVTVASLNDSIASLEDAESAEDRISRIFYDKDGLKRGELDAEGYLTEYSYDSAGQMIKAVTYKTVTAMGQRTSGTLTELRPLPSSNDTVVHTLYNAKGQAVGVVDARGYLTETVYDKGGNVERVTRYGQAISYNGTATLAQIRPAAHADDRSTSYTYTRNQELKTQTDPDGSVTTYSYNSFGQVTSVKREKSGQQSAEAMKRYDAAGRLASEIPAHAAALYAAAPGSTKEAVWNEYATFYTYDNAGKLLASSAPNGARTVFYYDADNRLAYTVNAEGEVRGSVYNSFNQLERTVAYGTRIAPAKLALLAGGRIAGEFGTQLVTLEAGPKSVQSFDYDTLGRVADSTDAKGNHTTVDYDAFGAVKEQRSHSSAGSTAANDQADAFARMVYNKNGQVIATVSATGTLNAMVYDANGNVTERTTYATLIDPDMQAAAIQAAIASGSLSNPALDRRERIVYDARGMVKARFVAMNSDGGVARWSVSVNDVDSNGNVVQTRAYSAPVVHAEPGAAQLSSLVSSADDAIIRNVYDGAGRLQASAIAQTVRSGEVRDWSITSYNYDARGNVTLRRTLAAQLVSASPSQAEIVAAAQSAATDGDAMVRYSYDQSDRLLATATALGVTHGVLQWAVTRNSYDRAGNLTSRVDYASAATGHPASEAAVAQWMSVVPSAADRTTRYGYDKVGRLVVTVDPLGAVSSQKYDAKGQVIETTSHATSYHAAGDISLNYQPATSQADRSLRTFYDANGRPVVEIDSLGAVTERRYDTLGNLVTVVAYAEELTSVIAANASAADVLAAVPDSGGRDRISHFAYDQDGRQRFSVDPLGYVSETRYDAQGRVAKSLQYRTAFSTADFTVPNLVYLTTSLYADARINHFTYDASGNLRSSTDALEKTEYFEYNALGQKTAFTNKLSHTWNYRYDAAGRMVSELSPQISVVDNAGTASIVRLETRTAYDTFGNLKSRTEAAGTVGERTTSYEYDLVGRQVKTHLPVGTVYDSAADSNPSATDAMRHERVAVGGSTVTVTYDVFGNAISNLAASDSTSQLTRKVHDKEGRVKFEIDALGHITGYEHNVFGEVTKLTRYAVAINLAGNPSLAEVEDALLGVSHADDRSVVKTYDGAGRLVKTTEPSGTVHDLVLTLGQLGVGDAEVARTTIIDYNAFGEAIRQRVVGMQGQQVRALGTDTRMYYNTRGEQIAKFDVVNTEESAAALRAGGQLEGMDEIGGYLTEMAYDDAGNVLSVHEYSSAQLMTLGWTDDSYASHAPMIDDRHVDYVYDKAGRKTSEIRQAVGYQFFHQGMALDAGARRVTNFDYDDTGNLTATVTAAVTADSVGQETFKRYGVTRSQYDALGRVTAVISQGESDAGKAALVEFKRDVHGNVVVQTAYAQTAVLSNGSYVASGMDVLNDRTTRTEYDIRGNAVKVTDAEGNVSYASYDGFGRVAKQWQKVTAADHSELIAYSIMAYDAVGNLASIVKPGSSTALMGNGKVELLSASQIGRTTTSMTYNGFGEQTSRSVNGQLVESTAFDNNGRAWRTNSGDGIAKVMFYNVAGQVTEQVTSGVVDLETFASADAVRSAMRQSNALAFQSKETRYNMLGYAVSEHGPAQAVAGSAGPGTLQLQLPTSQSVLQTASNWNEHTREYSSNNVVRVEAAIPPAYAGMELVVAVRYDAFGELPELGTYGNLGERTQYRTVSATEFADGYVEFGWNSDLLGTMNGSHVYVKDITGKLIEIGASTIQAPTYGVSIKAPPVMLAEVRLHYPAESEGSTILSPFANYGDRVVFETAGIRDGSHAYTVQYLDPVNGEWTDYASGTLTASSGQVTGIGGADATAPSVRRAASYQTVNRWGNVLMVTDPRDTRWTTYFTYNIDGQVVDTTVMSGYDPASYSRNLFDEIGRSIGTVDARGAINRKVYNADGKLEREVFADGGERTSEYNIFGDRTRVSYGHATRYLHDRLGRVIEAGAELPVAVHWTFNVSGGMQLHGGGFARVTDKFKYDELGRRISVENGSGEISISRYDLSGNLIQQLNPMMKGTLTAYDAHNHKVAETDANENTMTWTVDAYGRARTFKDLGGTVTTYERNFVGEVTKQTSVNAAQQSRQRLVYTYEGGLLTQIDDQITGSTTSYGYDILGRRVREATHALDVRTNTRIFAQNNFIRFDQLGRIQRVADGYFDVKFEYDQNGNRTRVQTSYINGKGQHHNLDERNTFDAMNRVLMANAVMDEDGRLQLGDNGHEMTYDSAGRRKTDRYNFAPTDQPKKAETTELFEYDGAGRLLEVMRGDQVIDHRYYDAASRVIRSTVGALADDKVLKFLGIAKESRTYAYDQAGRVARVKIRTANMDETQDESFGDDVKYEIDGASGYDDVGNLKGYTIVPRDNGAKTVTTIEHHLMNGYKEATQASNNGNLGSNTSIYDVNGHLVEVRSNTRGRHFINDADGRLLRKFDAHEGETRQMIVNGQVLGMSTNDEVARGLGSTYESASAEANGGTPTTYIPRGNSETLRTVAQALWGDGALWYLIAESNGLTDEGPLAVNVALKIPPRPTTLHNTFETFRPYNAAEMIGSTTPVLPMPKAHEACGGMGPAITMIVAALAASFTQQYWLMDKALWVAGAVSATVGSVAGQAAAIAMDMQDGFNAKEIALAAVGGGIGGAFGKLDILGAADPLNAFARGAIGSALTQFVAKQMGLQKKFSWSQVASSALSSGIGAHLGKELLAANGGLPISGFDRFGATVASNFVAKAVGSASGNSEFDPLHVVADAFGNALSAVLHSNRMGTSDEEKPLLSDRELRKIMKDSGIEPGYVSKLNFGVTSARPGGGSTGDFYGSVLNSRSWLIPKVEVVGQQWDSIDHLAYKFRTNRPAMLEILNTSDDWIARSRMSDARFYRQRENNASNSFTRELWHLGGLANKALHNAGTAGRQVLRIAVNEGSARADAMAGLKYTWDYAPSIFQRQVHAFNAMSLRQKSDALFTFGFETVLGAGAGKVGQVAGGMTIRGTVSGAKWLAPKAGDWLYSYAQKTGVVLNAMRDAPIAGANSASEARGLIPRVDVADKFFKEPLSNGGFRFTYGDPTTHGLDALVSKNGVLSFDIRANAKLAAEHGSGTDMAASLMNRLESEGIKIKQFDAQWMKGSKDVSTNYAYYNKMHRSVGELEAARGTWTGKFLANYGFDIFEPPAIVNVPNKTYLPKFVKVTP